MHPHGLQMHSRKLPVKVFCISPRENLVQDLPYVLWPYSLKHQSQVMMGRLLLPAHSNSKPYLPSPPSQGHCFMWPESFCSPTKSRIASELGLDGEPHGFLV